MASTLVKLDDLSPRSWLTLCVSKVGIMTTPLITIGVAGGSGGGKTTLARRLFQDLGGEENVCYLLHDYYYKDLSHLTLAERAENNFDHPDSLETELMIQHIRELKNGQGCTIPTYDFTTHSRKAPDASIQMEPRKIILVEGILILAHPELRQELDIKDCDDDIRLIRRLERDTRERGRTMAEVLAQYQKTVRPMHLEYVEPSKKVADIIIPSTGIEGDVPSVVPKTSSGSGGISRSMEIAISVLKNHIQSACATCNASETSS